MQALEAEREQQEAQLLELSRTVSELGLDPRPVPAASHRAAVRAFRTILRGRHVFFVAARGRSPGRHMNEECDAAVFE